MPANLMGAEQAWGFFQVFLRVVTLFTVAPIFGMREVPGQVRIGLALLLSLAVYPTASHSVAPLPADLLPMLGAVVSETVIGLAMGMVVSLLFQAALVAGELMDLQMGFGMASIFNPLLGTQAAMMGQFLYRYTLVIFLLLNGHHLLLDGLARSFVALPGSHLRLNGDLLGLIGDLAMTIIGVGIRIAAPSMATLFVVDIALALVSRAVPSMNVFVVGMPLKIVVGLAVTVAALGLMTAVLQDYIGTGIMNDGLNHLLRALGSGGKTAHG